MRWPKRLLDWLQVEARGANAFAVIGIVMLLDLFWNTVVLSALLFVADIHPVHHRVGLTINVWLPVILLGLATMEEVMFRFPLALFVEGDWRMGDILIVAVLLSALFGILHGGLINIFLQGVGGFLWSLVFLKCGGAEKNYAKGVLASTLCHFFFNCAVAMPAIMSGASKI